MNRADRITLYVIFAGWLVLLVALFVIAPVWVLTLLLFEALTIYAFHLLTLAGFRPCAAWRGRRSRRSTTPKP